MLQKESSRKSIRDYSLDNKSTLFAVRCTNYADSKTYYLKNGKFAEGRGANELYAFKYKKVSLTKLNKDGIYLAREITPRN